MRHAVCLFTAILTTVFGAYQAKASPFSLSSDEFPITMIGVDWESYMDNLAAMGVTYVHNYGMGGSTNQADLDDDLEYLDDAAANGIKVAVNLRGHGWIDYTNGVESMQVVVQALKNHPALGYWYFYDEPGDPTPGPVVPVEDLIPYYQMITNETPGVPAAICHWITDEWRPDVYGPVQDIMMPDHYPVNDQIFPNAPIDNVADFVREAMEPAGSKPVMPMCQVFNWYALNTNRVNDRYPVTEELRYWQYASLIQGTRGMVWWSCYHSIKTVEQGGDNGVWMRETFAPVCSNFRQFVDTVAPAHQPDQIRSDGRSGDDYLFLAVWERGGTKWVSLVNNRDYSRTKTVSMAGRISDADLIAQFGSRDNSDQITNGSLQSIDLGPWESYVWQAVPLGLRNPPENVQATGQSATRIDVTWTCSASGETGFKIDRLAAGETDWVRAGTAPNNATLYRDSGLQPHNVYSYRVKAYKDWNARYSAEVSGTTLGGIDVQPAAGSDDAEEDVGGTTGFGSADLDLGAKWVGIRFPGVSIPDGAMIESAFLQFTVSEADSVTTDLTLHGQAGDNPSPFTTAISNISGRATTTESVAWAVPTWSTVGAAGGDRRSPDLSSILQVIVDRPGWTSGNALALIINGTGERAAVSFDANPTNAPYLHIIYSVPQTAFESYNDLAWFSGQRTNKISRFTTTVNNPGAVCAGALVDHVTGGSLPIRVSVHGGSTPIEGQGSHPSSGTDAHGVFDGIVSANSTMSSGPTDMVLTLTGLRSAERYEFVLYGDRGNSGYTDRYHHVTLSGADGFDNESSAGTTILTNSVPNDTTYYNAGYNTANGYVTRFDGIAPGSDGAITITVPRDTNLLYYTYANAFMFRTAVAGPPAAPTDLVATPASATQIDLTWTDVATNELYYKAYRSPDGTTGWSRIDPDGGLPADTESFSDINCTPETTYYYAIRCINAAGNSEYSSTESATTPAAGPPTNLTTFTAYNDLAWSTGQTTDKITIYTTSNTVGGVRTGYLKDYVSGVTIDVRLTVSGGDEVQALQGYHPGAGTDAHTVFDGKVDCASTISYSEPNDLELEFSELSITGTYEVVIYPDRGGDYANRIHHATIGSADSFVNESTAGVTITTVSTLNDTTIFNAGTNTANGYVTRFTGIEPGSDGTFTVTLRQNNTTADYFSYANAVMLKSPSGDGGPGLTEKIVKGATWRYAKGTAEPSSPPTAWRSVAFDDSGWALGPTPLGYKTSVGGLATSLGDMYDGYPTVYMRSTFDVPNPAVVNEVTVQVDYDDGFILFINGQEMARVNVAGAAGTFMAHTHVALSSGSTTAWSDTWDKARLPLLRPGQNVVTLQLFNGALTSSDLYMDLVLALAEGSYLAPADDADADGMDDGWETANCAGGDGTATNDVDGDRVSDAGEFVAGTHPNDAASVFSLREEYTGDGLLLSFDVYQATSPYYDGFSRHYALEECLDLEGAAWSPVPGYSNLTAAANGTITYTNSSGDALILYRGRVWLESQ